MAQINIYISQSQVQMVQQPMQCQVQMLPQPTQSQVQMAQQPTQSQGQALQQPTQSQGQVLQQPPTSDPLARLAWLEQNYQNVWSDVAKHLQDIHRLEAVNQKVSQELVEARTEVVRLQLSRAKLEKKQEELQEDGEMLRTAIENLANGTCTLEKRNSELQAENTRLKKELSDHQRLGTAALEKRNSELQAENTRLKKEHRDSKDRAIGFEDELRRSKKRARLSYLEDDTLMCTSDSENENRKENDNEKNIREQNEMYWDRNIHTQTRLSPDAFEWLKDWCKENSDRIEKARAFERIRNQVEIRDMQQEKLDVERGIRKLKMQMVIEVKKRSRIQRKMLVLTDEEKLVDTNGGLEVEKKLFLFCKVMGRPQYDSPMWEFQHFVRSEREMIKIYHQVMAAMRVLHEDLVDGPKKLDKKFKPRNPITTKWQVLSENRGAGQPSALEKHFFSSTEDARLACTALQNLLYYSQQGILQ